MPSYFVQQQTEAQQTLYRAVTRQFADDLNYSSGSSTAPIRIVGDLIARSLTQYKGNDQSMDFTLTSKFADIGP